MPPLSPISQHVDTYCAVNPLVHDWRPSLPSGSSVCLELIGTVSSLNAFRDNLKTVLFRASFDDRT